VRKSDRQDPEDKVFMGRDEFDKIGSDPSIGAVLCGFDINISTSAEALASMADF
jgi:hypothetical protein